MSIRLLQCPGAEQEHQPDEAVAPGAAVLVVLMEDKCEKVQDLLLLDVVPLFDSGVGDREVMTTLIPRSATIPAKQTQALLCPPVWGTDPGE